MRLSEFIRSIRPASIAERSRASVWGVADGVDVSMPYPYAGWINVADSQYTQGAPRTILSGVRTQLTVNGGGATTEMRFADGLPPDAWDGNKFKPVAVGEAYLLRVVCTVSQSTSGSGHYVTFEADIGTDAVPFVTAAQSVPLIKGQGLPTLVTVTGPFFCLETFGRNGMRVFVTPSTDITLWGAAIFIQRTFRP